MEVNMRTLPLSEVKMKLSEIVDRVASTDDEVTITKNGRPAAIIMSIDEYESIMATQEILSDKEFMDEIRENIKNFDKDAKIYTLEELFDE